MMDLIANTDDIDGPGNNAYLYVGQHLTRFTVVPWDVNLAFGGLGSFSGAFPADGEPPQPPDGFGTGSQPVSSPSGTPAAGQELPAIGRGGFGRTIPLVERSGELPDFTELTEETRARLRSDLYETGVAAGILSRWMGVLKEEATDLVDAETLTSESDRIAEYFA